MKADVYRSKGTRAIHAFVQGDVDVRHVDVSDSRPVGDHPSGGGETRRAGGYIITDSWETVRSRHSKENIPPQFSS